MTASPRWYTVEGWRGINRRGKKALRPFRHRVRRLEEQGVRVLSFDPGVQFVDAQGRHYDLGNAEWEFVEKLIEKCEAASLDKRG